MAASIFDSAIYRDLTFDRDIATLFTDSAEVRAMMIVEGALAKVQGQLGVIPEISAKAIHRASLEIQIDPSALSDSAGRSADPVAGLVAHFRSLMQAPEHAQWVHFGASGQDIMDTALALRLRQVTTLYRDRLTALIGTLGNLAERHAMTPMADQAGSVTSFGGLVAEWGRPLLTLLERLEQLSPRILRVSLGDSHAAYGDKGAEVRAAFAAGLNLNDPTANWHSDRSGLAEFAGWMTQVTTQLSTIAQDLLNLSQRGELAIGHADRDATVLPSLLIAISQMMAGLNATMQQAPKSRIQGDATTAITEWMTLPYMCLMTGRALGATGDLAASLTANSDAMAASIVAKNDLVFANALIRTLTATLGRAEAEEKVSELCQMVNETGGTLQSHAMGMWADLDLAKTFDITAQIAPAANEAKSFKVRTTLLAE